MPGYLLAKFDIKTGNICPWHTFFRLFIPGEASKILKGKNYD
jgi:hypothetical protein